MTPTPHTRLALLATLSELHREPVSYDLAALAALVVELAPDLLCAEITQFRPPFAMGPAPRRYAGSDQWHVV